MLDSDLFALTPMYLDVFDLLITTAKCRKVDTGAIKEVFLGYFPTKKGSKYLDPCSVQWYIIEYVFFFEDANYFYVNPPQREYPRQTDEYSKE